MAKRNTIRPKIMKLITAIKVKHNKIYLYSLDRVWSKKLEKVCVLRKLDEIIPSTGKTIKGFSGFREVDILLELIRIYKSLEEGGEEYANKDNKDKDTG